jgi:hypothetical protein
MQRPQSSLQSNCIDDTFFTRIFLINLLFLFLEATEIVLNEEGGVKLADSYFVLNW